MKIVIGTSPMDIQLLDDTGKPLGVSVISLKFDLEAQAIPVAYLRVELWNPEAEFGNEIIINGVELDRNGLVLSEERGVRKA